MKLGIVVIYLFDADTESLLDMHLASVRKFTASPYTIYAAAVRLSPESRQKLSHFPEIQPCEIPPTDLREGAEHAYYLDHLAEIAIQDGSTHVVALHLDSFPVVAGWEKKLAAMTDRTGGCVIADRYYTACLFFPREFYLRYRPTFQQLGDHYRAYVKQYDLIAHSGAPYLYVCHINKVECEILETSKLRFGELYGGMVFHFTGGVRLSRGQVKGGGPGKAQAFLLTSFEYLRRHPLLHPVLRWMRKQLPGKVSHAMEEWLIRKDFLRQVIKQESLRTEFILENLKKEEI
jgi:hypothetical protein